MNKKLREYMVDFAYGKEDIRDEFANAWEEDEGEIVALLLENDKDIFTEEVAEFQDDVIDDFLKVLRSKDNCNKIFATTSFVNLLAKLMGDSLRDYAESEWDDLAEDLYFELKEGAQVEANINR
jgi:predicted kinase